MNNSSSTAANQTECQRCGTCCRKGGPALHIEDQHLVDSGKIPLRQLLTIRQGEPAYDNVAERIAPAVTDIIKLKAAPGSQSHCPFYNRQQTNCGIYEHRPVECAALRCWDVSEIQALYNCRRLTRRHLLSKVEGLWDLVSDHQQRCDYGHIAELADNIRRHPDHKTSQEELLELVRFDGSIRDLTLERTNMDEKMLVFLFGRPLSFTIEFFKVRLVRTDKGGRVVPMGNALDPVCYRRGGIPAG